MIAILVQAYRKLRKSKYIKRLKRKRSRALSERRAKITRRKGKGAFLSLKSKHIRRRVI